MTIKATISISIDIPFNTVFKLYPSELIMDDASMLILVSYVIIWLFRTESLYFTWIVISCSPNLSSPINSIGMLNGTGLSGSISSMYCVDSLMLESPLGFYVINPNKPSLFPSFRISPITVCCPDNSITLTP